MAKVSPVSIDRRTATEKKAVQLRSLHKPGDPLILVNVWDAASARVIAALPEVKAVGTTSWAISAALGVPDGENLTADEALYTAGIVVTSVDLPVTVDLERGYGRTADDVGATVSRLIMIGAVGCNLEDSLSDSEVPGGEGPGRHASAASGAPARGGRGMRPISEQVERLQAARDSGKRLGVPLVINARTDALLRGGTVDDAVRRGRSYLEAGADCVFVPGIKNLPAVRLFVDAFDGKLNVLARPGIPSLPDLAEAGVCRISFGPGPMGLAYAALGRAAAQLLAREEYPEDLSSRPPTA